MRCDKCGKKLIIYAFTNGVILECSNCGQLVHGHEMAKQGIVLRLYDWILIGPRR